MPYVEYDEVEASCSECGMNFRSEEALERHQVEVHSGRQAEAEKASRPRQALRGNRVATKMARRGREPARGP